MTSATYYRAWRAAHPEYRERQNRLRNERRARLGRDRGREYVTRPSRAIPPIPPMHTGHPIFDRARAVVGPRRTALEVLYDPLYDDLVSEATLALVEGRDPLEAVRRYGAVERSYGRITAPLMDDAA